MATAPLFRSKVTKWSRIIWRKISLALNGKICRCPKSHRVQTADHGMFERWGRTTQQPTTHPVPLPHPHTHTPLHLQPPTRPTPTYPTHPSTPHFTSTHTPQTPHPAYHHSDPHTIHPTQPTNQTTLSPIPQPSPPPKKNHYTAPTPPTSVSNTVFTVTG
jgi:hypothetical protein